MLNEAMRKFEG